MKTHYRLSLSLNSAVLLSALSSYVPDFSGIPGDTITRDDSPCSIEIEGDSEISLQEVQAYYKALPSLVKILNSAFPTPGDKTFQEAAESLAEAFTNSGSEAFTDSTFKEAPLDDEIPLTKAEKNQRHGIGGYYCQNNCGELTRERGRICPSCVKILKETGNSLNA